MAVSHHSTATCTVCKVEKDLEEFYKNNKKRNGRSSHCKACASALRKAKYYSDHDASKAQLREIAKRNSEKRALYAKQYHARNRNKIASRMAEYKFTSEQKKRRAEQTKDWKRKNKDKVKMSNAATQAMRRCADGKYTQADVKWLIKIQRCRCAICQKNIKDKYHVDHITPIKLGGTNSKRNLQILCERCNTSKGAKPPHEYMQSVGFLI
jgi:5-methylcytosine-specific restriction endonuclease McrA